MKNFYNSNSIFGAHNEDGFKSPLASMLGKTKCMFGLVMFMILTIGQLSWAQSTANYAFSANTTSSLALDLNGNAVDMSTGTTLLLGAGSDQGVSAVTNIGFNYLFYGSYFNQFSVSANGILQLGPSAVSGSTYTASGGTATAPKFSALGSDAITASSADGGGIFSKIVGTGNNRCLVIQWVSYSYYGNTAAPATFQIRLYETTGVVEYVYGSMPVGTTSYGNYSTGFSVGSVANTTASVTTANNTISYGATFNLNAYTAATNIANLHSTTNGSRSAYKFTPPTPAAGATALNFTAVATNSMTLNWTAASPTTNVVKYAIFNSSNGGVSYDYLTTVAVGTNTYAATGLAAGVTYYWKVVAISEGVEGFPISATQATLGGVTYYWVGTTGGALGTAANWNTNPSGGGTTRLTPLASDILIVDGDGFVAGGTTVINVDLVSFTLSQFKVTSNTTLTLQSSAATLRTITLAGGPGDDFIVESGSVLNLTNATNPIGFAFTGTNNTGLISGTLNFAGIATNTLTTTGGTGTLVTVTGTGIVNLGFAGNSLISSATTLSFLSGSNCNSTGGTTGAPPVPLATWDTASNLTISGLTTSNTTATNNNQSFGNFIFNCPLLTATLNFFGSNTQIIKGDLTIVAAGATNGTGIFRATSTGTITVNGNILISQGRFQSATTGTVIANGNTTVGVNGILDTANTTGTFSQRGTTLTNNGTLTGVTGTLQFVNFTGSSAQTLAGSGTVLTNLASLSVQNTAGLIITHTNPIIIARANLFQGVVTNSNKITFGTGLAVACVTQIGSAGLLTPGGSFDALPTFNLGTGTYTLNYAQESVSRTSGFEIPSTRLVTAINLTNSNGLVISGGALGTGTLNFGSGSGNITTTNSNLLTVTGTTPASIVRTSTTAFVNGPLAITLPASLATGSTYLLPVGKSAINSFALVNPTTSAGGTVIIKSEVFDAPTGGTAINLLGSLNTNRYWASSITSGSANFTNSLIQLNDTPAGADGIGGSATLTGSYDLIGGLTTTATATSLTSTAPAVTSLLGYYAMGTKSSPALSNLVISPTGNRCPNVVRNVTVTATPGGSAITTVVINYSINGTAQTAISMTNTSGTTWSGTIPTVTPSNATVAWSVTATDANLLTKNLAGTSYNDESIGNAVITMTSSVPNFCGSGGNVTLSANSTIPGVTYTWQSLTPTATLGTSTGASIIATITETSDFKVTGTPNDGTCPSVNFISIGVYPLPSATVTTTASGVCPGTSATIGSGLSAGNFLSTVITPGLKTAPANATVICNAGVGTPAPVGTAGVNYDDGGWANLPIGFNFNFFGTTYSTLNAGTNGNIMFGAFNATSLADFTFTTLPSTTEPFNMVALLAMDNDLSGAAGGTIKYWTEGYAPNRKFVISYENVKEYGDTKFSTFQGVFSETTGIIEVLVGSSTNIDRNKVTGVNNGNGTIGVLAYASGTAATTTPQNPITNPFSFRFSPPANYNTIWTATDVNGTTTIASGTNIFSQTVAPLITTTYSISYTNQTTGCTNAPGSAQVVMSILGTAAPLGVNSIATSNSVCLGDSVTLSTDYTGSPDGLVYQWQSSIDNGTSWQDIATATAATYTFTPAFSAQYRFKIVSCGGTPSYSTVSTVAFANTITGTAPVTRCGIGTVTLVATANTGATVKWYSSASGGTAIGTGSPFTSPVISASTIYYASAETTLAGPPTSVCSSLRVAVPVTVTPPPTLTLSSTSATICSGVATTTPVTITSTATDFDTYVWSPSTGVSGSSVTGWTFNPTATTTYTLNASQSSGSLCANTATFTVTTNALPSALTITPATSNVCLNTVVSLAATGGLITNATILSENFNAPTNSWTTTNNSVGGTSANIAWTLASSPLAYSIYGPFTSNDSSQFYISNNDSGGSGSTANTALSSPSFSTVGFINANVSFWHYFRSAGDAKVEYSLDSGSTWTTIQTFTVTTGAPAAFVQENIALPIGAVNQSNVQLRFKYDTASWQYFWAVDNVVVSGNQATQIVWSPTTNLFTDAAASVPYTSGTNASTVYVKSASAASTLYTATATSAATCTASATTTVTTVDCSIPYANLQFPGAATITTCATQTFYAQVYKAGVTEAAGQGTGITAWIGKNATNTDPSTWAESSWQLATFNVQSGNNDEYQTTFGSLAAGTYYVASRFVYTPGNYVYGGYTPTGGGIWDGTSNVSATLTVNAIAAPTAASPQTFCNSATVADLVATGTNLQWYAASTGGTALASTTALATANYYVSQTVSGCESPRTMVAVTVNVTPAPTATSPQSFCNSATVADLIATGTNLQWYAASTGGTALTSTTALATANYYVSQTISGCESPRTMVAVTVNVTPAPTATSPQSFCNSATVANLVATGTNLQWYAASTGGTALASTTALATANYYVSQTISGCEGPRTLVAVTVNVTPAPTATSPQTFCNSATVANLVATGTNLQWYAASTGGTALASTTALATANYYVSQTISGCESPRTMVAVTVNVTPQPTATSPQSLNAPATIANIVITGTSVIWYATNADAIAGTNPLATTTALVNNTTYYATQTISGCTSAPLPVLINVVLKNNSFDMGSLVYYPNPVIDMLNISYSNTISSIEVFNLIGQSVRTMQPNAISTQLDMSNLPTATYLVRVTSEGKIATIKVVKK